MYRSMTYYNIGDWNIKLGAVAVLIAKRVKIGTFQILYVRKLEIRFILGLNSAKNTGYMKKKVQIKVVEN